MKDGALLPDVCLRAIEPEDLEMLYSIENDTHLECALFKVYIERVYRQYQVRYLCRQAVAIDDR